MAKKVLSIEIGQQVTKAVVIDFLKKNLMCTMPFP